MRTRIQKLCELCGTPFMRQVTIANPRSGRFCSRSCGVKSTWPRPGLLGGNYRHGETAVGESRRGITPEYRAYHLAKNRCENSNSPSYKDYGGRGIGFRFESFAQFLAEVGRKPSPEHSIDRFPDNNGHYGPGNVRWALRIDQCNNRRTNHFITVNDETLTINQWAARLGIRSSRINMRLAYGYCNPCAVVLPRGAKCSHRTDAGGW